ncbi:MAG: EvpB family type VI secretion protein [Methylibium sp. NZG]|nr:MAG: EvpB family type VI secretion protein [Methylibium sp. NZG]
MVGVLGKAFGLDNPTAVVALVSALQTLVRYAAEQPAWVGSDVVASIQALIAQIDDRLSAQLSEILHHPQFQRLESAWRGLRYLVDRTETDETLKIRVLNISKEELAEALRRPGEDAWEQSAIFRKVYDEEFGQFGGEPFGCLVGDYHFSHRPADIELLQGLATVAAAAAAPFMAGADPLLMRMNSWQALADPRELSGLFTTSEYSAWQTLRDSEEARYIGLAMPRFLARLPYEPDPVGDFNYREDVAQGDASRCVWINAAYAMAANINRSFKQYGWCARIRGVESGGAVEGLLLHTFPGDDGSIDLKCPTEIAISDRREAELAKNGLMPLMYRKNTDIAAFIGAQSLHKPQEYDDADANANAHMAARWPYLFATCRFVHYLKCIVRDKIGSFNGREDMARHLNQWLMDYIAGDPENVSEEAKARYPLADADVVIDEVEGELGFYTAKVFLRPHYQLEGLTVSLRMVTQLPSSTPA